MRTQYLDEINQDSNLALGSSLSVYLTNYAKQTFSTGEIDQWLSQQELEDLDKENQLTPEERKKFKGVLAEISAL